MSISPSLRAPSPLFKEVRQECCLKNTLISLFKRAVWPFVSLYSGISNLYFTGKWLTTTRVLDPLPIDYDINPGGREFHNLPEMRRAIKMLQNGSYLSFHIGCRKFERHSTMLVWGKDTSGADYALFFDARGGDPNQLQLLQKEFETEEREEEEKGAIEIEKKRGAGSLLNGFDVIDDVVGQKVRSTILLNTIGELYRELVRDIENPPKLLYSSSDIQLDHVSCTAYTAVFFKKFIKLKTSELNPNELMEAVANHRFVTFKEARREVSNLGALV